MVGWLVGSGCGEPLLLCGGAVAVCTVGTDARAGGDPALAENPLGFRMIRAAQAETSQKHPAALASADP